MRRTNRAGLPVARGMSRIAKARTKSGEAAEGVENVNVSLSHSTDNRREYLVTGFAHQLIKFCEVSQLCGWDRIKLLTSLAGAGSLRRNVGPPIRWGRIGQAVAENTSAKERFTIPKVAGLG